MPRLLISSDPLFSGFHQITSCPKKGILIQSSNSDEIFEIQSLTRLQEGSFFVVDNNNYVNNNKSNSMVQKPTTSSSKEIVVSSGSLYMAVRMDPLFLTLPLLEEACRDKMQEVSVVVEDEGLRRAISTFKPSSSSNQNRCQLESVLQESVCDCKEVMERVFVRLNDLKLRHWLRRKHLSVCKDLLSKKFFFRECCVRTSTLDTSAFSVDKAKAALLAQAILKEYLVCPRHQKILEDEIVHPLLVRLDPTFQPQNHINISSTDENNIELRPSHPKQEDVAVPAKKKAAVNKKPEKTIKKNAGQLSLFALMARHNAATKK